MLTRLGRRPLPGALIGDYVGVCVLWLGRLGHLMRGFDYSTLEKFISHVNSLMY